MVGKSNGIVASEVASVLEMFGWVLLLLTSLTGANGVVGGLSVSVGNWAFVLHTEKAETFCVLDSMQNAENMSDVFAMVVCCCGVDCRFVRRVRVMT